MRGFLVKSIFVVTLVVIGTAYFGYFRVSGADSLKRVGSQQVSEDAGSDHDIGAEFSSDSSVPFHFETGRLNFKISQHAISPAKDAAYISANYKTCGPKYRPQSYFPDVVQTMKKLPETAYSIGSFQIVLIPNLLGYNNLAALQEDFFSCQGDTGMLVSAAMNEHWLVFTRACPVADSQCMQVAAAVTPTIRIK